MPRSYYVTANCSVGGSGDHNNRTCPIELAEKARDASEARVSLNHIMTTFNKLFVQWIDAYNG